MTINFKKRLEKEETYIRYDLVSTVPTPGYQDNTFPICEIEIQLKDKILTQKRYYTQLIDVLGEVGGFMEIISSFFGAICSFIVDILYEEKANKEPIKASNISKSINEARVNLYLREQKEKAISEASKAKSEILGAVLNHIDLDETKTDIFAAL